MVIRLKCVSESTPVFSWKTEQCNDKKQVSYRIIVSTTEREIIWDSGEVFSDASVGVPYGGSELNENTKYLWRVTVTTENTSCESEEDYFITGLYNFENIKWIAPDKSIVSPIVSKEFHIKEVKEYAVLNICGLGFFEVYINGKKVSDELMSPVRTDYDNIKYSDTKYSCCSKTRKSVKYLTYEVAKYLKQGTNKIEVWLANGWYRPKGRTRTIEGKFDYGEELKMFFRLTNGNEIIESDTDCICINSPIVYDNIFYGEIYDARIKGITYSVHKTSSPSGRIEPQLCPSERIIKTYVPAVLESGVYDAGICMTGFAYLCNKENPRQTLTGAIATKFYEHPYYSEGGVYTTIADSTMTFKTDANEIFISYLSGADSNDMVILVNDKEVSTFSTASEYPNMNYVTKGVSGVKGKTITIKAKNYAPLRIFAIIERFN